MKFLDVDITPELLERLVRKESPYELPDSRYPVFYGHYGDPRTEIDTRLIGFHKYYWKQNLSDLEVSSKTLEQLFKATSKQIYTISASLLVYLKKALSSIEYEKYKTQLIDWILALKQTVKGKSKAKGYFIITDLPKVNLEEGANSDFINQRINQLNTQRYELLKVTEKLQVIEKTIQAKSENKTLVYAPNYADKLMIDVNKYGLRFTFFEPLWKSDETEIVKDFVNRFSAKDYESDFIERYINTWLGFKGLGNPRAKAKNKMGITNKPSDGTLKNWEARFNKFVDSRSET